MPPLTLCVIPWNAERPEMRSHAERGDDQVVLLAVIFTEQRVVQLAVAQDADQFVVLL